MVLIKFAPSPLIFRFVQDTLEGGRGIEFKLSEARGIFVMI